MRISQLESTGKVNQTGVHLVKRYGLDRSIAVSIRFSSGVSVLLGPSGRIGLSGPAERLTVWNIRIEV